MPYQQDLRKAQRQQMLAQMLMQQAGPQGAMVGNSYAPPSTFANIANALSKIGGVYAGAKADERIGQLEDERRKKIAEQLAQMAGGQPTQTTPGNQAPVMGFRVPQASQPSQPDPAIAALSELPLEQQEQILAKQAMQRLFPTQVGAQGVQSTVIGENGNFYTVDRATGVLKDTGIKAAPSMRVVEQEGNVPFGVVTGRGPVGKVLPLGGAPDAPAPMRQPTAGERARDVASAQAGVDLATKPEIAKQTELAKTEAERTAALPGQLSDIQKMKRNVEGLLGSPGFDTIYGMSRRVSPSMLPGQKGADSQARLGQIDAQAFQTAIQSMRGLGALSNAEGMKVSSAFTRATDTNQSEKAAREAWGEVLDGLTMAEERLRTGATLRAEAPTDSSGAALEFASEADAEAAAAAGKIKPGQRINVGGQTGVWQ